jgi:hypothetical protein
MKYDPESRGEAAYVEMLERTVFQLLDNKRFTSELVKRGAVVEAVKSLTDNSLYQGSWSNRGLDFHRCIHEINQRIMESRLTPSQP